MDYKPNLNKDEKEMDVLPVGRVADFCRRYYDYPPKEYYNGTYTYEESTKTLSMRSDDVDYSDGSDPQVCHAEVTTTRMTWTYPADEDGYVTVEYYVRR